jgi:hypothetical protein
VKSTGSGKTRKAHLLGSVGADVVLVHLHIVNTWLQGTREELKILHLVADQDGATCQFLLQVGNPSLGFYVHGVPTNSMIHFDTMLFAERYFVMKFRWSRVT